MKTAIGKLETEIMQQDKTNASLQQHLDHLRSTLSKGFGGVKLPGKFQHFYQNLFETQMSIIFYRY